ncbi:MAG TPA: OPT/YSL family transporter [Myxococcota bacterium]|jgi:putative OPT family oligopeptide transporter|nr:OPT/YSL family transporter [Myxococcota bacterium]
MAQEHASAAPAGGITPRAGPYPEVTVGAVVFGVVSGSLITVVFTYTAMVIGFSIPASAIATMLGYGFFRGVARLWGGGRKAGSILSVNLAQAIASGINVPAAGVTFTVPALFLLHAAGKVGDFSPWPFAAAVAAGSVLGVAFIIPLRKQMIDLERLRFPSGVAVAAILRSPGAGVEKSKRLIYGATFAAAVTLVVQLAEFGVLPGKFQIAGHWFMVGEVLDVGASLRVMGIPWPQWMPNVWALSMLSVGAGYMSGAAGFTVLIGGILANWIIAPATVMMDWAPTDPTGAPVVAAMFREMNRPVGIGMLVGGAVAGVITALPQVRAAFGAMRRARGGGGGGGGGAAGAPGGAVTPGGLAGKRDELPMKLVVIAVGAAFVVLGVAGYFSADIGVGGALLVAGLGTLWLWLAGIIVSQCTGMTDWSPISGMALIAVTLLLYVTGKSVFAAVLIGAAVCVAVSVAADMMTDLKIGHLVGSRPAVLQFWQLVAAAIGPVIALGMTYVLWKAPGHFGPGTKLPVPQAQALQATIEAMLGGATPWAKYGGGALVGGLLSFLGIPGLGVLVGLSMYLPVHYVLTYGIGCTLNFGTKRFLGARWVEDVGVPLAAGLLVGDPLVQVVMTVVKVVKDSLA